MFAATAKPHPDFVRMRLIFYIIHLSRADSTNSAKIEFDHANHGRV